MPSLSPQDLDRQIEQGRLAPVYLLFGEETYLVEQSSRALREAALKGALADFNADELDAKSTSAARVVEVAQQLPMMAAQRWVRVREIDGYKAAGLEELIAYLAKPSPTTVLCLTAQAMDQRTKLYKTAVASGVAVQFKKLYEREASSFLQSRARKLGLRLEPAAAALCVECAGTALAELAAALEKLALYVHGRDTITVRDVEEVVSVTRLESVFKLTDAIGKRDTAEALRVVAGVARAREPGLKVLALVARHLRQLLTAREAVDRGSSPGEAAREAGVPPYFADAFGQQLRRHTPASLRAAFTRVAQADLAMKGSGPSDRVVLERLVLQLCR